jgi:hypothetical protein
MTEPVPVPAANDPAFIENGVRLAQRLKDDPEIVQQAATIIADELSNPLTPDSFGSLSRRFGELIDEEAGVLLLNSITVQNLVPALTDAGIAGALEDLDDLLDPLRYLRGLYKERLQKLQRMWRELPDDWDAITREITVDPITTTWFYKLTIDKYDGDQIVLAGPARSIVGITSRFVSTILQFPGPWVVDKERFDEIKIASEELTKWLARLEPGAATAGIAVGGAAPDVPITEGGQVHA